MSFDAQGIFMSLHSSDPSGVRTTEPTSTSEVRLTGRFGHAARVLLMLAPHALVWAVRAASHLGQAVIRFIPEIRRIDAEREVRLRQLEIQREQGHLAAAIELASLASRHAIAAKSMEGRPPTSELAEVIKALNPSKAAHAEPDEQR